MARSENPQIKLIRYAVFGMAAAVVLGLALFGWQYSAQNTVAEAAAGGNDSDGDYLLLARPLPDPGEIISVREFFSYACGHCNKFEPVLKKWEQKISEDVEVKKIALGGNRIWSALARAYYAMDELDMLERGHLRLFDGIHGQRLSLATTKSIAEYLADEQVNVRQFYDTANGEVVEESYKNALQLAGRFGVNSVPTLIVAGKYLVSTQNGTRYALKVVDELIEKERSLRATSLP